MTDRTLINDKPDRLDPFSMTALQCQLARIKKEEEEDILISEEDLYTEGSSDEEVCEIELPPRRKLNTHKKTRGTSNHPNIVIVTDTSKTLETSANIGEDNQDKGILAVAGPTSLQKGCPTNIGSLQEPPAPPPTPTQNSISKNTEQNYAADSSDDETEEPVGFSWKAKRGTIVLPNCTNLLAEERDKC